MSHHELAEQSATYALRIMELGRQRDALAEALRACLLRDDIAADELGDVIRAALAKAQA